MRARSRAGRADIRGGANTLCEDSSREGKDKARGRRGIVRVGGGLMVATSRAAARAESAEGVTWEVARQSVEV